tara:strand:+ start:231 stop:1148 length:918 start_codon:yes stop_codon:yes gene_type:complete
MKKTILITGGAGFIGSHLTENLVQEFNIIVVDNLSTGYIKNLESVIDKIKFINNDVDLVDLYKLGKIDVIVHLSAQTSVPLSIQEFKKSSNQNLIGALNVIDFSRMSNVPIVYASSSAVYGNLSIGDDASSEVDLISPYAVDKYVMEKYLEMSYKLYGLSSIGLRFFNVFGPRQDPTNPYSGVISIFIDNLISGKKIKVNGGYQTRDFVYVLDVVNAIKKSIGLVINKPTFEVVNVLSGYSCSIDKLVEILAKLTSTKPKVERKILPHGDPVKSDGTIEKMSSILGIELNSLTSLELGLKKIIEN